MRPRVPRSAHSYYARSYLRDYEQLVTNAEAGTVRVGCPCCGGDGLYARDQLEALIVRGGRRGRRIAGVVAALDERFRRATVPDPYDADGPWWRARLLD